MIAYYYRFLPVLIALFPVPKGGSCPISSRWWWFITKVQMWWSKADDVWRQLCFWNSAIHSFLLVGQKLWDMILGSLERRWERWDASFSWMIFNHETLKEWVFPCFCPLKAMLVGGTNEIWVNVIGISPWVRALRANGHHHLHSFPVVLTVSIWLKTQKHSTNTTIHTCTPLKFLAFIQVFSSFVAVFLMFQPRKQKLRGRLYIKCHCAALSFEWETSSCLQR